MNWNDLKKLDRKDVEVLMPKGFNFKLEPWKHQMVAFLAATSYDGFMLAMDMGTGKTKVSIDACRYLLTKKAKVLVIALESALENWQEEVALNSDFSSVSARGNKDKRWDLIGKENFYIINYESLRSMLTVSMPGYKGKVLSEKLISEFCKIGKWDAIIIDESHKTKSVESTNFQVIGRLCKNIKQRMLLTGTPFGNTLLDVWAQYYLVDFGETFGNNYASFRFKYFSKETKQYRIKTKNGTRINYVPDWKLTEKGRKEIEEKLYNKAIRYDETEVDELPEKVFRVLRYELSKEQRVRYDSLLSDMRKGKGEDIVSAKMTFRQICSSFIIKTGEKFKSNPKLDVFWDLVESVKDAHKILVFYEFIEEFKDITGLLIKKKVPYVAFRDSKDKHSEFVKFDNDPLYRVAVVHPKSGGESLNWTAATYCVFYTNGHSVIQRKQCVKRIHRGGQFERCFFYDIIGNRTVESSIHKGLMSGIDVFDKIVDKDSIFKIFSGR